MATTPRSRREALGTLISALAAVLLLGRYLRPGIRRRKTLLTVAKADLPRHGALVYRESRVAIVRAGEGLYALDLACTHLGCTVNVTPTGLACPCHGSRFDREGNVVSGPADRPLRRYGIEARGDFFEVVIKDRDGRST